MVPLQRRALTGLRPTLPWETLAMTSRSWRRYPPYFPFGAQVARRYIPTALPGAGYTSKFYTDGTSRCGLQVNESSSCRRQVADRVQLRSSSSAPASQSPSCRRRQVADRVHLRSSSSAPASQSPSCRREAAERVHLRSSPSVPARPTTRLRPTTMSISGSIVELRLWLGLGPSF